MEFEPLTKKNYSQRTRQRKEDFTVIPCSGLPSEEDRSPIVTNSLVFFFYLASKPYLGNDCKSTWELFSRDRHTKHSYLHDQSEHGFEAGCKFHTKAAMRDAIVF